MEEKAPHAYRIGGFAHVRNAVADGFHDFLLAAESPGEIGFDFDAPRAAFFNFFDPGLDGLGPSLVGGGNGEVQGKGEFRFCRMGGLTEGSGQQHGCGGQRRNKQSGHDNLLISVVLRGSAGFGLSAERVLPFANRKRMMES